MASHAIRQRLPLGTTLKKISDDKTHKGFYNASAYKKETAPEPYAFLQYVSTNIPGDDFTSEIFDKVEANKRDEKFRSGYLRCNIHDFDKLEEGIAIDEKRAKLEAARNMLLQGCIQIKLYNGFPYRSKLYRSLLRNCIFRNSPIYK